MKVITDENRKEVETKLNECKSYSEYLVIEKRLKIFFKFICYYTTIFLIICIIGKINFITLQIKGVRMNNKKEETLAEVECSFSTEGLKSKPISKNIKISAEKESKDKRGD